MSANGLPLVSIITVVRNGAATISLALESVRAQRQVHVEHIVIDGASTDGTVEKIKSYQNSQLRWISEPDKGIYDAMNKGVSLARGEWLLFLGADDILADASVLMDIFQGRDLSAYDLVCGHSRYDVGQHSGPRLDWRTQIFNTIHHQAAFYRRRLFDDFSYRTDILVVADYEMNFLLYLKRRPALFLDCCVAICGSDGISHTSSQLMAQIDTYKIRRRYINPFRNATLLVAGIFDLAVAKLIRPAHKHR